MLPCRKRTVPNLARAPAGKASPYLSTLASIGRATCPCGVSAVLGPRAACMNSPAPVPIMATDIVTAAMIFTFVKNRVFRTVSVRAAAFHDTAELGVPPAPTKQDAFTVECRKKAGTAAGAAPSGMTAAPIAVDNAIPRRVSSLRNHSPACSNRLLTVLGCHPSCFAACSRVRPSMQQRTTGARRFSGSRANSRSRIALSSRAVISTSGSSAQFLAARFSRIRRRLAANFAFKAMRKATP
jgi:hypothetical protein